MKLFPFVVFAKFTHLYIRYAIKVVKVMKAATAAHTYRTIISVGSSQMGGFS